MVASASSACRPVRSQLRKHGVYVLAAIAAFPIVCCIPLHFWGTVARWCIFAAIALCALVLAPAWATSQGGRRRIDLAGFPAALGRSPSSS